MFYRRRSPLATAREIRQTTMDTENDDRQIFFFHRILSSSVNVQEKRLPVSPAAFESKSGRISIGPNRQINRTAATGDEHQDRAIAGAFESRLYIFNRFHTNSIYLEHYVSAGNAGLG